MDQASLTSPLIMACTFPSLRTHQKAREREREGGKGRESRGEIFKLYMSMSNLQTKHCDKVRTHVSLVNWAWLRARWFRR